MNRFIAISRVVLFASAASVVACGGQEADNENVASISLSPNPFGVERSNTVQLSVTAMMKDGTTIDLTKSEDAHWSTSDSSTAIVDEHGVAFGVSPGVTQVTVAYEGMTDTVNCTVIP